MHSGCFNFNMNPIIVNHTNQEYKFRELNNLYYLFFAVKKDTSYSIYYNFKENAHEIKI